MSPALKNTLLTERKLAMALRALRHISEGTWAAAESPRKASTPRAYAGTIIIQIERMKADQ